MNKTIFYFQLLATTIMLFVTSNSTLATGQLPSGTVEGSYKTTFRTMTLNASGNTVTGTYESGNGRLTGNLIGNKLSGTWTNSASGKRGKFEFVFKDDFSSFTGKYGYNDSAPSSLWNGTKIDSPSSTGGSSSAQKPLPINVSGSWSQRGDACGIARANIWQEGNRFIAIISWVDVNTKIWKSYKGEGEFEGREMNFKVFPSVTDGTTIDQGYVYHWTVSTDNNEITGFYTRNGKRNMDANWYYNRVK